MILVHTSSLLHLIRPYGDPAVRGRVITAVAAGQARWCSLVKLEVWHRVRTRGEREALRLLSKMLPELPIDDAVSKAAHELARQARSKGIALRSVDAIIVACARSHGAALESADSGLHLRALATGSICKSSTPHRASDSGRPEDGRVRARPTGA